MKYFSLLLVSFLMMGCVGKFTDRFIYIDSDTALISWRDKDSEYADKGAFSARANSEIYEEYYSFDEDGQDFQIYLVMFAKKYAWVPTSTETAYKRVMTDLPLVSHAEELAYSDVIREPKFAYARAIIDRRACVTFMDYLQQHARSQGKVFRSQLFGVYCAKKGDELTDAKISKVLASYVFDAPAYDGRGIMVASDN
ncbi:hypothetical protein [Curvivirga sp.]|uniref:hypothetical protein n=1 Tax=Curvivirga sp. TaxID=2856848 RepID=UPI003B5CC961